jgi:hypothetical protein
VTVAHAQDFVVNDELQLSILKAFVLQDCWIYRVHFHSLIS